MLRGVLEQNVRLRMPVRGISMAPFLRDWDRLTVAPLGAAPPRVGEVIAFTHPRTGRLTIHRVIQLRSADGDEAWLARGDNCPTADGWIGPAQLVGRVVRADRGGRPVRLGLGPEGRLLAWLNRGQALGVLVKLVSAPRRLAAALARSLQSRGCYRALARLLVPRPVVALAAPADLAQLERFLGPNPPADQPHVTNLVARVGGRVGGFVQFIRHPPEIGPWAGDWLSSLYVRPAYRGLGLGAALTRAVIALARARGTKALMLAVYPDNTPAWRLYRSLGFAPCVLATLEAALQAEETATGRRRVILSLDLAAGPNQMRPR